MPNQFQTRLNYLQTHTCPGKRNNLDIIADILNNAKKNVHKTRIMYNCNLSFKQLNNYLKFLQRTKLLQSYSDEKNNRKYFRTTSKGSEFLKAYSKLRILLD